MSVSPQRSSDGFHAFGREEVVHELTQDAAPEQNRREHRLRARWARESAQKRGLPRLRSWLRLEAMVKEARRRSIGVPPLEANFLRS